VTAAPICEAADYSSKQNHIQYPSYLLDTSRWDLLLFFSFRVAGDAAGFSQLYVSIHLFGRKNSAIQLSNSCSLIPDCRLVQCRIISILTRIEFWNRCYDTTVAVSLQRDNTRRFVLWGCEIVSSISLTETGQTVCFSTLSHSSSNSVDKTQKSNPQFTGLRRTCR
jgi:hypothetical protein